jgi:hypothetical protein
MEQDHPTCWNCDRRFHNVAARDQHGQEQSLCTLCLSDGVKLCHLPHQKDEHEKRSHPKCDLCQTAQSNDETLKVYVNTHPKCDVCNVRQFNYPMLEHHKQSHPKCAVCGRRQLDKEARVKHVWDRHFMCTYCREVPLFKTRKDVRAHLDHQHPLKKDYAQ